MKNYQQVKQAGTPYDSAIRKAAEKHGVNYDLMHKLIYIESKFDPKAVSPTGAKGIAQFVGYTGKAFGLKTDADRFDPWKSIEASAAYLSHLSGKLDGDEALIALGYNQGLGGSGRKQVEAAKRGDWSQVKSEGLKYMKNLADVVNPEQLGRYNYGSEPTGVTKGTTQSVPEVAPPKAASFQQAANAESTTAPLVANFSAQQFDQGVDPTDKPEGFFAESVAAIANTSSSSFLGSAFALRSEHGTDILKSYYRPTAANNYKFTAEDYELMRSSGLPSSHISALGGARSTEDLKKLIENGQRVSKLNQETAEYGTAAQIIGEVGAAAIDPLSYVPIVGQAGKAASGLKIVSAAGALRYASIGAQSAVAAVGSEMLREAHTGTEADFASAIAGGAIFGAGLSAALDGVTGALGRSVARLEAHETARNLGIDSEAVLPHVIADEAIPMQTVDGLSFKDNPVGDGSVILEDGSIVSRDSPLNPRFRNIERSAPAARLGGYTELGVTTLRSENEAIRGIANDLFRSSVGLESGASGKAGMTVTDILDMNNARDRLFFNKFNDMSNAMLKDPAHIYGNVDDQLAREAGWRNVFTAIEKPEKYAEGLTKAEKALMDELVPFFNGKLDDMQNPAKFGDTRAKAILESTGHEGRYTMNVYDDNMRSLYSQKLGGKDKFQAKIKDSWLHGDEGYYKNPKVKAQVKAYLESRVAKGETLDASKLDEMAEELARNKAYGISNADDFTYSAATSDALDAGKGLENNNFLESRHPFDSDSGIAMDDGSIFRVNDLRSYRADRLLPSYARRVNGDVAVMGGTGRSMADIKGEINALGYAGSRDGKLKAEGEALMSGLTRIGGLTTIKPDDSLDALLRAATNTAFMTKNAWMGVQNITEVAAMVVKGHTSSLFKGVPMMNKFIGGIYANDKKMIDELQGLLFGRELDDSLRPRRADMRESIRANSSSPEWFTDVAADLQWATREAARALPAGKLLNGFTNHIIDASRTAFLNDIVTSALKGTKGVKPSILKSAAITDDQYKGIESLIQKYITKGKDGKLSIKQGIQNDPRAMDLWRLGDHMASEAIQRGGKTSNMSSVQYGAKHQAIMQFKSFVLRSLNSTALRSLYEATKNGRAIEQVAIQAVSIGLAGLFFMGRIAANAQGMSESDRKAYLDKNLDEGTIGTAALLRARGIGAPLSVASTLAAAVNPEYDIGRAVRTSMTPKAQERQERPETYSRAGDYFGNLADQVPILGMAASAGGVAHNAAGLATSKGIGESLAYRDALYNSMRNIVPNDPVSQAALTYWFQEHTDGIMNK